MMLNRLLLATLIAVTGACLGAESSDDAGEVCSIPSPVPKVFGGTKHPTVVPLQPGQILAIGSFGMCSGTLISPTWVLTARHCPLSQSSEYCIGKKADDPNVCIPVTHIVDHPSLDLTLVQLTHDARHALPQVVPIPIMTEVIDCDWLGHMAEAAGYGKTTRGTIGTRYFTAEPIVELDEQQLTVDGQGLKGLCRGDSGGPMMVVASDGTTRVAGALSNGHISCRGLDFFTRVDRLQEWIESYTESHDSLGRDRR